MKFQRCEDEEAFRCYSAIPKRWRSRSSNTECRISFPELQQVNLTSAGKFARSNSPAGAREMRFGTRYSRNGSALSSARNALSSARNCTFAPRWFGRLGLRRFRGMPGRFGCFLTIEKSITLLPQQLPRAELGSEIGSNCLIVPQIQNFSKCKTFAHTTSAFEEGEEHISLGQTCAFHKVCYLGL